MLSRRQFFSRLKSAGFSKSRFQMTRVGITYEKETEEGRVSLTVPKSHSSTFTILGDVPYSGIFFEYIEGRQVNWGISVRPADLGLENMLEVCLGLVNGDITMSAREPMEDVG